MKWLQQVGSTPDKHRKDVHPEASEYSEAVGGFSP